MVFAKYFGGFVRIAILPYYRRGYCEKKTRAAFVPSNGPFPADSLPLGPDSREKACKVAAHRNHPAGGRRPKAGTKAA